MSSRFYDIHCHAMNMSHPNLLAFVKRFEDPLLEKTNKMLKQNRFKTFFITNALLIKYMFFKPLNREAVTWLLDKANLAEEVNRAVNLLALMENDLGSFFILMENCLKEHLLKDRKLVIGSKSYDRIVLTPLMMDFGNKNLSYPAAHYNQAPIQKPIVEQVVDLFNGIQDYNEKSKDRLFDILPFMGLNTKNYRIEKIEAMLYKYFSDYQPSYESLTDKRGPFEGEIDSMGSNFWAGVKVYPPLGFDPWPENDKEELEKVKLLYSFCNEKRIPITSHCSGEGYCTISREEYECFTAPSRWEPVLRKFEGLKLNLAHFGRDEIWMRKIIGLIAKYENVYTDFSNKGDHDLYYAYLNRVINEPQHKDIKQKLQNRILFGSDFMINLLSANSYCEYLGIFTRTQHLTEEEKDDFCRKNCERFLFGGPA